MIWKCGWRVVNSRPLIFFGILLREKLLGKEIRAFVKYW